MAQGHRAPPHDSPLILAVDFLPIKDATSDLSPLPQMAPFQTQMPPSSLGEHFGIADRAHVHFYVRTTLRSFGGRKTAKA